MHLNTLKGLAVKKYIYKLSFTTNENNIIIDKLNQKA